MKQTRMASVDRTLYATAHHEAAHAVAAWSERRPVLRLTIEPDDSALGACRFWTLRNFHPDYDSSDRTHLLIEREIVGLFAGFEGERRFRANRNMSEARAGSAHDFAMAARLGAHAVGDDAELEAFLRWLQLRARNVVSLDSHWTIIQGLAAVLLRERTLNSRRVRLVLQQLSEV